MAVLVTPPWDLCGGPGFYPYAFDAGGPWRYTDGGFRRAPRVEPDPNRHDGRWGELAFMPHSTIPFTLEGRTVFVPAYPSLASALAVEAVARQMARFERRVLSVHERVACPRCGARAGERCVRASAVARAEPRHGPGVLALKHPHSERLRADGIYER